MNIRKNFPIVLFCVLVLAALVVMPVLAQGETPPPSYTISAVTLLTIVAGILSLTLDYFPNIAAAYDALTVAQKRLIAVGLAVLIVVGALGLTCYGLIQTNLICSPNGVWDAISNILYVFAIQYAVHQGTKPTEQFKRNVLKINAK